MRFNQNDHITVTPHVYYYVREYKRQLVFFITKLLDDLNIKFVISHGNLIEYERGSPIHHDDDVDIRMNIKDCYKWVTFCKENNNATNYNLVFDSRFKNKGISSQQYDGIQCRLITFINKQNINKQKIKEYKMDMHCDLVASIVECKRIWSDYNIDYSDLRKINYLGVETYAPNKNDTKRVLIRDYGINYLIPHKPPAF